MALGPAPRGLFARLLELEVVSETRAPASDPPCGVKRVCPALRPERLDAFARATPACRSKGGTVLARLACECSTLGPSGCSGSSRPLRGLNSLHVVRDPRLAARTHAAGASRC